VFLPETLFRTKPRGFVVHYGRTSCAVGGVFTVDIPCWVLLSVGFFFCVSRCVSWYYSQHSFFFVGFVSLVFFLLVFGSGFRFSFSVSDGGMDGT